MVVLIADRFLGEAFVPPCYVCCALCRYKTTSVPGGWQLFAAPFGSISVLRVPARGKQRHWRLRPTPPNGTGAHEHPRWPLPRWHADGAGHPTLRTQAASEHRSTLHTTTPVSLPLPRVRVPARPLQPCLGSGGRMAMAPARARRRRQPAGWQLHRDPPPPSSLSSQQGPCGFLRCLDGASCSHRQLQAGKE